MAKDFYVRTIRAGRYIKSVRYRRSLPSDSDVVRAAKSATTSKAQKYINLKNAAERLQMLLCANYDTKDACFCTFTYSEDNLPANRKMSRQCIKDFLSVMRREWKKQGRELKYIYNIEGTSLAADPKAKPVEGVQWEVRPWQVKSRWDTIEKPGKKAKDTVRFHEHCFLILNKADREMVQKLWVYGIVFINPIKVELPDTFHKLAYYVTKDARNGSLPSGARSYVPSRNLEQPVIESHWCEEYEVLQPPANAEHIHTANETTDYASFQYCSYRLPRQKRQPKSYKSKGRI